MEIFLISYTIVAVCAYFYILWFVWKERRFLYLKDFFGAGIATIFWPAFIIAAFVEKLEDMDFMDKRFFDRRK